MENIWFAFVLTLFAGLSTGIGGLMGFFANRKKTNFLCVSLGFSAGVMIYVSLVDLFQEGQAALTNALGDLGPAVTVASFFGGILLVAVIDKLIPEEKNPHEPPPEDGRKPVRKSGLLRTGLITALAIAVHNFPEGLATSVSALQAPEIAISIAVAVAIHNIPEGIAVSMPVYYATGSRGKAFLCSLAAGLTEPLGAVIGYLILRPFLNDAVLGILFAAVAGIMVFISLDELLPSARRYGKHHLSIYGLIAGMAVMAVSLLLL